MGKDETTFLSNDKGWQSVMAKQGVGTAALLLATAIASPAQATWLKATSDHFVVYSDTTEADIAQAATQLEHFDGVVRRLHHVPANDDAKANPVTIYVVRSITSIERLCRCQNVAGYYVPRVSGSVAFTPRIGSGGGINDLKPQIVLFHEYAHHFLLGNYAAAYPAWFSEGYAEFVSTVQFDATGAQIGAAANHRAGSLLFTKGLKAEQLFATGPRPLTGEQIESVYARGWLLTHAIMFDPVLREKFNRYLQLLNAGTPSIEAARQSFGDLRALDRTMDKYLNGRTLPGLRIPLANLPVAQVKVRALTAGERGLIELRMQSDNGVGTKTAAPLYARAAKIAAATPNDPVAQGWLAEMAYDAGEDAAAEAAVDRALAVDPKSAQALLYKARVHLRRAVTAKSTDAGVWREARSWIIKANRANPNDAEALSLFYDSFGLADAKPSASAITGLRRAHELVPQDPGLRLSMARQDVLDNDVDDARRTLRPLAFDAHAGADNPAARLLVALDAGKRGQAALDVLDPPKKADAQPSPDASRSSNARLRSNP